MQDKINELLTSMRPRPDERGKLVERGGITAPAFYTSMRPRPDERGKDESTHRMASANVTSMRPRPDERGKVPFVAKVVN